MAKVSFTKLGLKLNQDIKIVEWNEQLIEVKQYLPINEKLDLISRVINSGYDPEINYFNPIQTEVYLMLEIIEAYTNINFTEKQKEDPAKLYDLFTANGLLKMIIETIPENEYAFIENAAYRSKKAIYKYRTSILGVLESVKNDYSNTSFNIDELQNELNSADLTLVKNIAEQLG